MMTETMSAPSVERGAKPAVGAQSDEAVPSENAFEWQRFWIRLQHASWSSLALVPVDAGVDVRSLANQLVTAGHQSGSQNVSAVDAVGISTSRAHSMIQELETTPDSGERVVIACDPLAENPATLAISRAVSGVLLVARLGESRISTTRLAVDAIGRERVVASITLQRAR